MMATQTKRLSFESSQNELLMTFLQVFGASIFLAFCSYISLPLYFNPVPLSAQTFGVMLIGTVLGSRKALLSVSLYIIEGSLGLPVFAGGHFGLLALLGPTGGYFLGFLLQAFFVGYFTEKQKSFDSIKILMVLLSSCALQLICGALFLSFYIGFPTAITMGILPFIVGEIVKSIALTFYLKKCAVCKI